MSWDFEVPTTTKKTDVSLSWEDGIEDDEPVLESWDIDSDEEREKAAAKKKAAEEERKKKEAAKKAAKAAKANKGNKGKKLLDIDTG
ncbi:unnamed protein product [Ambrosiozyma monospora]|uniref:Unnamed protein product n=1 Tax=Ambrosiozyma monospora TaxID=43982 RepID=A0ACB5TMF5_AMBMO|nr:unnamed protein product [Ambrosiozyma monospora]